MVLYTLTESEVLSSTMKKLAQINEIILKRTKKSQKQFPKIVLLLTGHNLSEFCNEKTWRERSFGCPKLGQSFKSKSQC
jgi:hypothetical protein